MDVAGKIFANGGNKALALPHSEAHFKRLANEAYTYVATLFFRASMHAVQRVYYNAHHRSSGGRKLEERLRELRKEKREAFSLWSYERYRFTIAQHVRRFYYEYMYCTLYKY